MSRNPHQPARRRGGIGGQRELTVALLLTAVMMLIELAAGWLSGSLSLMADAGHMLADSSALGLSLFAAWFSTRPATTRKTYGYYRMEILAALANGVALCLIVVWIYVRAVARLFHPAGVETGLMLAIAVLGLLANLLGARILSHAGDRSLNVQGARLNVLSDALGSVGVILAGCLIRWRGWTIADPLASMVIGVLIAVNGWKLITQAVNILLEGAPGHVRIPEVTQALRAVPGVRDVHDIHLWTITTGLDAMSGHVVVADIGRSAELLNHLNRVLSERFGITHTTVQIEPGEHSCAVAADASRG